ncbi:ACT domain-containing protein [Geodermatophilus sp. SYSU D01036]
MAGERDLDRLLAGMAPRRAPGTYVFATVPGPEVPAGLTPFATVREDEGLTVVVLREEADRAGLASDLPAARVTLHVHSDLAAVGLTAAVSTALAAAGISCNVVAGYHHDHLFVPVDDADRALTVLEGLTS